MAGRRIFVAGEILTAANVQSFLQDQAVMVFDDSTARGSAIPTPSEGMVTYLKDTDNVEKYNGSAFVPVGGLVEVKSAIFTGIQSASVAAGAKLSVTNLSITHTMQNSSNKLLISAYVGHVASNSSAANVGLAVADGGTLLALGDAAGTRTRVAASGRTGGTSARAGLTPAITFVYLPGDTVAHTYTVEVINVSGSTQTLFVNRNETDDADASGVRSSSSLVIQEVAV